jgi:hypothetical protein
VAARDDGDIHWPATLKDLSTRGVGLVLGRRFERGAALAVELPALGGRPADTLLVRVVRVQSLGGGRWLLGCSLVGDLSDDQLESIVGPGLAEEAPPARREHVIPGVVLRILDMGPEPRLFRVRRLFLKGSWPPAAGTVLRVRTGKACAGGHWLRLRVLRCEQQDGRWTVTCAVGGRPPAGLPGAFGLPAAGQAPTPRAGGTAGGSP